MFMPIVVGGSSVITEAGHLARRTKGSREIRRDKARDVGVRLG